MVLRVSSGVFLVALLLTTVLVSSARAADGAAPTADPGRSDVFLFSTDRSSGEAVIRIPYDVMLALSDPRVLDRMLPLVNQHGLRLLALLAKPWSPGPEPRSGTESRRLILGFGPPSHSTVTKHARFAVSIVRSSQTLVPVVNAVSEVDFMDTKSLAPQPIPPASGDDVTAMSRIRAAFNALYKSWHEAPNSASGTAALAKAKNMLHSLQPDLPVDDTGVFPALDEEIQRANPGSPQFTRVKTAFGMTGR